jgi:hyperosmotically inducible protein
MILANKRSHTLFAALVAGALVSMPVFAQADKSHDAMSHDMDKKSAEPVTDTWITTKVKADLLATKDVSGVDIKVDTANGVVMLSGAVDNQAQIDKASSVARMIDGVKSVDTSGLTVKASAGN